MITSCNHLPKCSVTSDGETWICKPTGMNQGKGIYLVSSREQLMEKLNMNGSSESSARWSQVRPPQGRVIQRYIIKVVTGDPGVGELE